jgi:hypothetical protein
LAAHNSALKTFVRDGSHFIIINSILALFRLTEVAPTFVLILNFWIFIQQQANVTEF